MNGISKREKAERARVEYVASLRVKGIRLIRIPGRGEVKYETESGKVVGIPFATERPKKEDSWWWGLPNEYFDFVILLCQTHAGEQLDFVLPTAVCHANLGLLKPRQGRRSKFRCCAAL